MAACGVVSLILLAWLSVCAACSTLNHRPNTETCMHGMAPEFSPPLSSFLGYIQTEIFFFIPLSCVCVCVCLCVFPGFISDFSGVFGPAKSWNTRDRDRGDAYVDPSVMYIDTCSFMYSCTAHGGESPSVKAAANTDGVALLFGGDMMRSLSITSCRRVGFTSHGEAIQRAYVLTVSAGSRKGSQVGW